MQDTLFCTYNYCHRITYTNAFLINTAIKEKLEKSLVIMGEIGGNDFNGPFYAHKTISEVSLLVPKVVKTVKDAIEVSFKY